jgi:hypothetical protein
LGIPCSQGLHVLKASIFSRSPCSQGLHVPEAHHPVLPPESRFNFATWRRRLPLSPVQSIGFKDSRSRPGRSFLTTPLSTPLFPHSFLLSLLSLHNSNFCFYQSFLPRPSLGTPRSFLTRPTVEFYHFPFHTTSTNEHTHLPLVSQYTVSISSHQKSALPSPD